jgi:mono/diheme cytochrome c family protein
MVLVLAMTAYGAPLLAAGDAAAGKAAYLKKCASCHGQAGEGKEAIAKTLKVELKHLGSKEVQSKSDADLKKTALQGAGKMKPVKDLDDKSADDIVAYLRTLAKK